MFGACTAPVDSFLAWVIASGTPEPALDGCTEHRVDEHPGHPDADKSDEPPRAEERPGCERDERGPAERAEGSEQGDPATGPGGNDASRHHVPGLRPTVDPDTGGPGVGGCGGQAGSKHGQRRVRRARTGGGESGESSIREDLPAVAAVTLRVERRNGRRPESRDDAARDEEREQYRPSGPTGGPER